MAERQGWFSAQDLAGLPGMPETYSAVIRWMKKNLAESRSKPRGKGLEYSRESLPQETREYLEQRDTDTLLLELGVTDTPAAAPTASATALAAAAPKAGLPALAARGPEHAAETTAAQREIELARTLVVHEVRSIERAQRCKPRAAACLLLERARAGQLRPALLAKLRQACDARGRKADGADDGLPSLVSLQRWMRAQAGGASLAPRASAQIDLSVRPWHRAFFALADRPQKPDIKSAHAQLAAAWQPAWGAQPPSYDAVLRAYAKYSALDKLKGRHSGSALRARTFFHRRTYDGLEPFAEVHADGWTSHFTAPHPVTGEYVTLEIWHFHDVATRFVTPMAVGQTESGDVILQGLEACIRVGGVPAIWQTDHTSSVK